MIVVTGGAGFIGSALVAALNQRQIEDIIIVDILGDDQKWKNLRKLTFCDYLEADEFFSVIASENPKWKIETIFHLGACSDTTETDCTYLVKNNYDCSKMLANWARKNNTRFIYASSAATYGDGLKGFKDDQEKIQQLIPLNMYGYSKQMFDLWAKRTGLLKKAVGLKYFNVFGPNEYHKANMRSFIIKAFEQINKTKKVCLFASDHPDYSNGNQVRDFLYIKDAVKMTLFFYDNPKLAGIYNIGTAKARTWNDLAKAVFDALNITENIEYIPMPENLTGKYQYFTQADIEKLRKAGYKDDTITLEAAIEDYIKNYLIDSEHIGPKDSTQIISSV